MMARFAHRRLGSDPQWTIAARLLSGVRAIVGATFTQTGNGCLPARDLQPDCLQRHLFFGMDFGHDMLQIERNDDGVRRCDEGG